MILRGQGGETFTLVPAGYEFAIPVAEAYDDNWLAVTATATVNGVSWGGTDPCLLSWELRGLCTWLRSHAEGGGTADDLLDFMEPELTFEVTHRGGDPIELTIAMRYALSCTSDGESPEGFTRLCQLKISRAALVVAAEELMREAGVYPQR